MKEYCQGFDLPAKVGRTHTASSITARLNAFKFNFLSVHDKKDIKTIYKVIGPFGELGYVFNPPPIAHRASVYLPQRRRKD